MACPGIFKQKKTQANFLPTNLCSSYFWRPAHCMLLNVYRKPPLWWPVVDTLVGSRRHSVTLGNKQPDAHIYGNMTQEYVKTFC